MMPRRRHHFHYYWVITIFALRCCHFHQPLVSRRRLSMLNYTQVGATTGVDDAVDYAISTLPPHIRHNIFTPTLRQSSRYFAMKAMTERHFRRDITPEFHYYAYLYRALPLAFAVSHASFTLYTRTLCRFYALHTTRFGRMRAASAFWRCHCYFHCCATVSFECGDDIRC